ncbi:MAG: hypothetical protein U0136_16555 [Bdellovibrionota bacterium]
MRATTVLQRYDIYAAAATLAAHAGARDLGFRQRDVRFLIQLFSNWTECTLGNTAFVLNNTQVFRYLDDLVKQGFAKAKRKRAQPDYQLTRLGLIELVTRVVRAQDDTLPDQFFFRCYFLRAYRPKIFELIEAEGTLFPHSLKLELEALMDVKALIQNELKRVESELLKLEKRASDAQNAASLSRKLFGKGVPQDAVIRQVEKQFPYELNSQKPLSDLLSSIPADYIQWELEVGNSNRADQIWQPSLVLLRQYRDLLRGMK